MNKPGLDMVKSNYIIIMEFLKFIGDKGGLHSSWYVGVAEKPKETLFLEHGVDKKSDCWIVRKSINSTEANRIKRHLLNYIGTDGKDGEVDKGAKYVYMYRKNSRTNP